MSGVRGRRGLLRLTLAAAFLVAGCAGGRQLLAREETPGDSDWHRVATPQDRTRLRQWRTAWVEAIDRVKQAGAGAELASDPALFDPDKIYPDGKLPDGQYRCRLIKVGARDTAIPAIGRREWTHCRVERITGGRTFALDGRERLFGNLFDHDDTRQVFLGTLALGDETRAMHYGRDAKRDSAGFVERIGKARWRLILPYPAFGSTLDLVEIVPDQ